MEGLQDLEVGADDGSETNLQTGLLQPDLPPGWLQLGIQST